MAEFHNVVESWEDIDADGPPTERQHVTELSDRGEPSPAGAAPQPTGGRYQPSSHANAPWQVAYTSHPGRHDEPAVHSDLAELLTDVDHEQLQSAFLTSFYPFEPAFLNRFPLNIDLTVCVQDKMEDEPRKEPKFFFGIPLHEVEHFPTDYLYRAQSTYCTRCLPFDNPRRTHPKDYLKACRCPVDYFRKVQWIFPQLKGRNIMHAKLMLLKFDSYVRLVVSSFNLSEHQWTSAGDSFWWADLPLCSNSDNDERVKEPLMDMLCKMHAPESWLRLLHKCDWGSVQQVATPVYMVTSAPDLVSGCVEYGMGRLNHLLRSLPRFPSSPVCPVMVQVWSLGGADDLWFTDFSTVLSQENWHGVIAQWQEDHVRFIVENGPNWQEHRDKSIKKENKIRAMLDMDEIPLKKSELKKVLWQEQGNCLLSARQGLPVIRWGWHSKLMSREYPQDFCKRPGCTRTHGWRYLGSHNCSLASWGGRDLPSRNWEAGMLIVSLPALTSSGDCGIDLHSQAPLPFQTARLTRKFPWL